jgi:hypothetical protein
MPSREAFACIRDIDASRPETWQGERVFLTVDIDWAHDEVLGDTIDLVERADVNATWFVTHHTPLLARLRANPKFELGIHPNFNFLLLAGDPRNGATAEEVVDRLMTVVPEAAAVRSHSTTLSTGLLNLFARKGLRYDCNCFVPHYAGMELKPWDNWTGMTMVPYSWEDDVAFLSGTATDVDALSRRRGIKVFDFHPIHVFLNTESSARYEAARGDLGDPGRLRLHRNPRSGTRTVLTQLMGIG